MTEPMTPHSQDTAIAIGFGVMAVIALVWALSALRQAWTARNGRTAWWWAIGGWMTAQALLFAFLTVVWISDFFEKWVYVVLVWVVVGTYLNAFIRWIRLGDGDR